MSVVRAGASPPSLPERFSWLNDGALKPIKLGKRFNVINLEVRKAGLPPLPDQYQQAFYENGQCYRWWFGGS
jgi:hypothetical protein